MTELANGSALLGHVLSVGEGDFHAVWGAGAELVEEQDAGNAHDDAHHDHGEAQTRHGPCTHQTSTNQRH